MKAAWSGPERYSRSGGRAEGAGTVGNEATKEVERMEVEEQGGDLKPFEWIGRGTRIERRDRTELDALFEIQTSPFTHNFYIVEKERGLESKGIT